MIEFRGMELDFDLYDAENAETYEQALDNFSAATKEIPTEGGLAESIRYQCGIVFDFFDDIFGDGFHKKVFGTRTNLVECLDAFEDFTKQTQAQKNALSERMEMIRAQNGNRATRRATGRASVSKS